MKNRVRDDLSPKTISDHKNVHAIDRELRNELGDVYHDVSRGSIYRRIAERTGYCAKRVAWILNHTTYEISV